jgi:uncharacterized protein (DUF1501 family)
VKVSWSVAVVALVGALAAGGCSSDPTDSEEYAELEGRLVTVTGERDRLAVELAEATEIPPILREFEAAYESGDLAQVQALYTEDGIFASTDEVHDLYYGNQSLIGAWGREGTEFRRTATLHGGDLEVFGATQVGDRAVAFGWRWSDFASGTGVLHLRDGRIVVCSLAVAEFEIQAP